MHYLILFLAYVNDIEEGVNSHLLKFADDTKIIRPIKSAEDTCTLQNDLNSLSRRAAKWQIQFNISKCKVIHFGSSNLQNKYYLDDQELGVTHCEKDLSVIIQQNFDSDQHVANVTMKVNKVLRMIARTYENKQPHNISSTKH